VTGVAACEPRALAALAHALGAADDRQLVAAMALIDTIPVRAAIDELLGGVRPRLWQLRPPRKLSLRRVLTVPVEALLADPAVCVPGGVRMPRTLLPALFAVTEPALPPQLRDDAEQQCRVLTTADIGEVHRLGRRLWPAAAAAMRQALLDPRATNRALAARSVDGSAFNDHGETITALLGCGEHLAEALLPIDGEGRDPGSAAAPHRAMLLRAAETGWVEFRAIASSFLLRAPSPDTVVRLIAQARLSLRRPALLEVVEDVVASLSHELGSLPEPAGNATDPVPDARPERRSEIALRLAMILGELAGQGARLEALAAETGQALVRQFAATLDNAVLAPLEALHPAGRASGDAVAAIEAAARASRRMEVAGRAMGRAASFAVALAGARARLIALARRSTAMADPSGAIALPDLVRLVEILSGPDAALAMIEELAAEA
jgi:hypothetical protein